jgi:DNA-binding NtrC family response regulator/tetratricopeptide (TPR) repeat protein
MSPAAPFAHPRYLPGPELGRGAQGVVVRVHDREAPGRALVAKVWLDGAFREQALLGEFALLARARIPGMVRAHDLARCARSGAPFLIEDFVDGPEALDFLTASPAASRGGRLLHLLADLAGTLALLHESGFVHGDLKPAHVRVIDAERAPRAMLLDLGAAVGRAREIGAPLALTTAFAAPELLAGGAPSPRSDLFALGALAWALCTGAPPPRAARRPLRELAAWVPPGATAVIEALLAEHPRDRPEGARALLFRLGVAQKAAGIGAGHPPPPIGRERELARLQVPGAGAVRYLVGPSGAGKSHLAGELYTRALLEGRSARLLRFPADAGDLLARLVAFLRGSAFALPFLGLGHDHDLDGAAGEPLLLILDDLDRAPAELGAALDAFRCRGEAAGVEILATARSAPAGAETVELGPLDEPGFAALCRALSIDDPAAIAAQAAASGRSPGWLVASAGRVPLTRDTAMGRLRGLSPGAVSLLAAIALAGGELSDALCRRFVSAEEPVVTDVDAALGELGAASLLGRRALPGGVSHALSAPALAVELGAALCTFERVDRLAAALLDGPAAPARALLAAADAPSPPARRLALLERAAQRARAEGLRAEEIEALHALGADPAGRRPDRLCRLERLCRDSGTSAMHPQVLGWLAEAALVDPSLRPLALRRRAESQARAGDAEGARALAAEAGAEAQQRGDALAEALSLGTQGLCALFRADWGEADRAISEARARLSALEVHDPEEVARVDHNLGVIALYRGRNDEAIGAFERSLGVKRTLGDRAGMRSCLLNLGLALAKAGRLDEAERVLGESLRLAGSLGQAAGRGWSLAALADVAVRRRDPAGASAWIAEARLHEAALPAAVRADLAILRAQVALLEDDGARALAALGELSPEQRRGDPLIDARALSIEAGAHLLILPVDARRAARLAVAAIRMARRATLPEAEAQALAALRAARARSAPRYAAGMAASGSGALGGEGDAALWAFLGELASGATRAEAALSLSRLLARAHGAERAFVVEAGEGGALGEAWGADLDGLPIAEARGRLDEALCKAALGREGPVYQREAAILGGKGARLGVAAPAGESGAARALVILEHRFRPGAFDQVTATDAARWATLAGLALRVPHPETMDTDVDDGAAVETAAPRVAPPAPRALPARRAAPGMTTAVPLLEARRSFPTLLGQSPALRRALGRLDAAIDGDLPVLIIGETGAGKELFARALHESGPRARRALVTVNCGAIPDALFEAELFGHARGSFTGADRARAGLLARAEKGTLFLDEIGELPLLRQAGLLRALQEKRYRPVGSDEELPFDVRIVAATNRDLEQAVLDKEFRQDLLYRLNAVEIHVPPLRERRDDIPLLCRAFLARAGAAVELSPEAEAALSAHDFPGNVRELEHLCQRLGSLGVPRIGLEHLPRQVRASKAPAGPRRVAAPASRAPAEPKESEQDEVTRVLAENGGNISRAAASLGLTRQGLKKRMVRLGMRAPRVAPDAVEKVS